jgi:hypothetical protein
MLLTELLQCKQLLPTLHFQFGITWLPSLDNGTVLLVQYKPEY